ncbi:MAG: hypothetical protein M3209_21025 [Acidobacteriota bacterium]|nr:hypothetical protein [Acidobacteriota bacterium]
MNEFSILGDRGAAGENRVEENKVENAPISDDFVVNESASPNLVSQPVVQQVRPAVQASPAVNTPQETARLIEIPVSAFEQDLAINDRRQKFAGEILRLALIGIAAIGFLLLNFLFGASDKAPEAFATAKRTLANSDFRFYVFASFYLFAFSAGIALLQRYFAADGNAYHLKYLRLREQANAVARSATENVSHLIPHSRRGFFDGFWLYLFGAETDEIHQQTENEKDARDFLFKISRFLLFLSGFLLWMGALSLILAFGVVLKQFGT